MKEQLTPLDTARDVLAIEAKCILAARDRLDSKFEKAVDTIFEVVHKKGGKLIVTGVGKSGKIAAKVAATMSSTGTPALFMHPTEGVHGDLGILSKNDVLLTFSYSGNSTEILHLLPNAKEKNAKIISIVGNIKSTIAQHSDLVIDGSIEREACPLNLAPTSSTAVAMALGDALAMALSVRSNFKAENFAENHPGGALGKRLLLKVSDLMKSEVPWVDETMKALDVVNEVTAKKLGTVMVRPHSKTKILSGIITDGDIRRSLKSGEKFFTMTAAELMTKNPVKVLDSEKAIKALELMENRPSQIGVLPVTNEKSECIGLVRVHDLISNF